MERRTSRRDHRTKLVCEENCRARMAMNHDCEEIVPEPEFSNDGSGVAMKYYESVRVHYDLSAE